MNPWKTLTTNWPKLCPNFQPKFLSAWWAKETRSWEFTFNCPKTSCTLGFWWKQRQIVSERKCLLPRPHWISANNFSKMVSGLWWAQPNAQGSLALWVRTSGNTQTDTETPGATEHGHTRKQMYLLFLKKKNKKSAGTGDFNKWQCGESPRPSGYKASLGGPSRTQKIVTAEIF